MNQASWSLLPTACGKPPLECDAAVTRAVGGRLVPVETRDVAKEFNPQIAAALSASQLRDTWLAFREQVEPIPVVPR
jgi:hypothetical protein